MSPNQPNPGTGQLITYQPLGEKDPVPDMLVMEELLCAAITALLKIDEIFIDGCDTYEDRKAMGEIARGFFDAHPESLSVEPNTKPSKLCMGDIVTYRITPYRGAEDVIREGTFVMYDYETTGGYEGSFRTGNYVIERPDGRADIINFDQVVSARPVL